MLRKLSVFLCLILAAVLVAACGQASPSAPANQSQSAPTQPQSATNPASAPEEKSAPEEGVTLSGFAYVNNRLTTAASNYNEVYCYQEMERQTGVRVEWIHPPVGQETEQCNLLIASGDLPDFIMMVHTNIGGVSKLLSDEVIIPLNEYLDAGMLPNYQSWMDKYEEVRKQLLMDDGTMPGLYMLRIREHNGQVGWFTNGGLVIRQDWLDKLGLDAPETVDDLYGVLKAFKEQDPNGNGQRDEIPFVAQKNVDALAQYFGTSIGFNDKNGVAAFGPLEPSFRDYIETMALWYSEGLIDPDFTVTDEKMLQAKFVENRAGSYNGNVGGSGTLFEIMRDTIPDVMFAGVTNLKKDASSPVYSTLGDLRQSFTNECSMITTKCTNVEAALRVLDWPYGPEGYEAFNWGELGVSYEKVNGANVFTGEVLENPNGYPVDRALTQYAMSMCQYSMPKDPEYWVQLSLRYPYQIQAIDNWGVVDHAIAMPPVSLTPEESTRNASIMNEINTLREEMVTKMIIGTESLSAYDDMVQKIESLGVAEAVAIQQAALDRYNAR